MTETISQNMAAQCLDHSRQKCAIIDVSGN